MSNKTIKIIFWATTSLFVLFNGVMPAVFFNSEMSKEGIRHLGYPPYFGALLVPFKILGALALILPMVPKRIKEWAYAGFTFDIIFAFASHAAVDGLTHGDTLFVPVFLLVLGASYWAYHRLN